MKSWATTWSQGEEVCFALFQSILGGNLNKDAFIGEIPVSFDYETEKGMWMFAIIGGSVPLDFDSNTNTPGGFGTRKMGALWEGYYTERTKAMAATGQIMDAVPLPANTLNSVYRLKPSDEPSLERGIIPRSNDQTKGGDMRVWKATFPFEVMLRRTDQP